jgi:predicted nuclease of predicted toxin-antitoxin system
VRLLLDESVPRPLVDLLAGHDVKTVQAVGWSGVENGELLQRAADAGFDALVTVDAGFEFQQNPSRLPLSVVLLRARSNRLEDLEPLLPEAINRLRESEPCAFLKVGV